jgi:hypothetical protein
LDRKPSALDSRCTNAADTSITTKSTIATTAATAAVTSTTATTAVTAKAASTAANGNAADDRYAYVGSGYCRRAATSVASRFAICPVATVTARSTISIAALAALAALTALTKNSSLTLDIIGYNAWRALTNQACSRGR